MSAEENKVLVRRLVEEIISGGKITLIPELLAPDYVEHNVPPGFRHDLEGVREGVAMFRNAFPDIQITYEQQVAEGDYVAGRYITQGTHQGMFMGIPPTGRTVRLHGMDLVRCVNGRIAERWSLEDNLGLLQQLGAIGAAEGAHA